MFFIIVKNLMLTWRIGGLVVSVPACGLSDPCSNHAHSGFFGSRNVNHETFRDIRSVRREGGIGWITNFSDICKLLPISNYSHVYSFLAVTFPSISRKVPSYLWQCAANCLVILFIIYLTSIFKSTMLPFKTFLI